MDTSDDALFGGGGGIDIPSRKAENVSRTARPVDELSEQAKKNKRLAASILTKSFAEPTLSKPGLLGLSENFF